MSDKTPASLWRDPNQFIAFGFGSGAIQPASGTWGTVASVPFYLLVSNWGWIPYTILTLIICLLGIRICHEAAKAVGVHDHSGIVLDEFAGFFVTMIAAPKGWAWIVVGFVLFRIFDVLKPWPISLCDKRVRGGFGIMLDDFIAGIFALICLQAIHYGMLLLHH